MGTRILRLLAVVLLVGLGADSAWACHKCHKPSCSGVPVCIYEAPRPAYQCVTEMVPYTVTQTRMRMDFRTETFTCMKQVPDIQWIERTCMVTKPIVETRPIQCRYWVCRPVYSTSYVQRVVSFCRLVPQTTYVPQTYTVCRPVTTTRQVTDCILQPTTQVVAVPVVQTCAPGCGGGCGLGLLCGKKHGMHGCGGLTTTGCQYVAQTCYTPVPVTRMIAETQMVPETQVRQVPVTTCHWVNEQRVENVPVTTCRYVREERVETTNLVCCRIACVPEVRRFPVMQIKCVPEVRTRMVPICVPETVQVTCYRPVQRMVPICPPAAPIFAPPVLGPAPGPSLQMPASQTTTGKETKEKKEIAQDEDLTSEDDEPAADDADRVAARDDEA